MGKNEGGGDYFVITKRSGFSASWMLSTGKEKKVTFTCSYSRRGGASVLVG